MIRDWPIISREQIGDFKIFALTQKKVRSPRTGETREVQEIFRLANQFGFKVIPTGTHLMATCEPALPEVNYVIIDPKRMDYLKIDAENMYAIIDPYVTFARLQVAAMKHGLNCYVPSGGSQISVLANLVFLPISGKLKNNSDQEVVVKEMIIEGVLSIQLGEHPNTIQRKLLNILAPKMRSNSAEVEAE